MKLEFHPEAVAEFEAAADFYHSRQPGLELRFQLNGMTRLAG